MALSRRRFLTLAGAGTVSTVLATPLQALYTRVAQGQSVQAKGFGALVKDPKGVLDLPPGFSYREFSAIGNQMSDGNPVPGDHDGMAAFAGPNNTTILVRNHELSPNEAPAVIAAADRQYDPLCKGGTTTLIVAPDRSLVRDFVSLAGTYRNCAGGTTPWGSWISCEEAIATPAMNKPGDLTNVEQAHGYNFEVLASASGPVDPIPLKAMGRFNHEAIAVDPATGTVYQTEDRGDGLFYRFMPTQPGKLQAGGILQALKIKDRPQAITKTKFPVGQKFATEWITIEQPDPPEDTVRQEGFSQGAAQFSRGEGICYSKGEIYFTCTDGGNSSGGQIWRYTPSSNIIELFVESGDQNVLDFPDNLIMAPFGDLIVCEDGFNTNNIVGVTPQGEIYRFAHNAMNESEFAGVCFSPDGQTMFVNIQTPGTTLAIWGPWKTV
ncbi:MAG: PhoX family protein [Aphanocapsa sp. GSE-SYN-MK-11-07L]|jgi:hypothetical protein|nr:PhoX family protein [Aphanocapsa sp. GSE-SYN-MK-11-07L]